jgi:hypothetical protein
MLHQDVSNLGDREPLLAMPSFCLEEFVVHLQMFGSQANLQQLHNGSDLQNTPLLQCFIFVT